MKYFIKVAKNICLISLFALLSIYFTFSVVKAEGQTLEIQTSLSVNPSIIEVILDENVTTEKNIIITNLSNLAQPIKASVQGFTQKEKVQLTEAEKKIYDSSSWITISDDDKDFILQPNESKTVTLFIDQPSNATPGGHYATVYFQPLIPQELVSNESIFIYSRVAVLVFMQTKGDIIEDLSIENIKYNSLSQRGQQNFELLIHNSGNTHSQPVIYFKIVDDSTGQLVEEKVLESSLILPGTTKRFLVNTNINEYFGRYKAEFIINYNSAGNILRSDQLYITIFPINETIYIFIPTSLFLIIFLKYRKRLRMAISVLFQKNIEDHPQNPDLKGLKFKMKKNRNKI